MHAEREKVIFHYFRTHPGIEEEGVISGVVERQRGKKVRGIFFYWGERGKGIGRGRYFFRVIG